MSLRSMTGFGAGQASSETWRLDVEVSSVNRKQFDCYFSLPREISGLESLAQTIVRKRIKRGHIRGVIRLHGETSSAGLFDSGKLRNQLESLRELAAELGLNDDLEATSLLQILNIQGAAESDAPVAESIAPLLETALNKALDSLIAMRVAEGSAIVSDLRQRLQLLHELLQELYAESPRVLENNHAVLKTRVEKLCGTIPPDDPTLMREIALLADKCDISEELVRLESHLQQANSFFATDEPCGRAFDFLCQELFREINTIGSKANDAKIARIVISFKTELEAIREQIQNVE